VAELFYELSTMNNELKYSNIFEDFAPVFAYFYTVFVYFYTFFERFYIVFVCFRTFSNILKRLLVSAPR
jgi:hypothetical protein